MHLSLDGKVALVTGGSRGIGAATVDMFVAAGAKVMFNYRTARSEADALVRRLGDRKCAAVACELAGTETAQGLVAGAVERFGRLDILIVNHGVWPSEDRPIDQLSDEQWRTTVAVNLDSVFALVKHAVGQMKRQDRSNGAAGHVVLVSSTAGQRGEAFHCDYAATKGAMISMVKGLATELATDGIYVNCVAPGWVETDMSAPALADPRTRSTVLNQIPLRRAAKPAEIAAPILFLCTPHAGFITGEIFNVNGGAVLAGSAPIVTAVALGRPMDRTNADDSVRRIMDGSAWNEFCDALKAAGAVVLDEISPADPATRAEGYRYLTRLLRAGLETFVEDADPTAPELVRTCHETIKMGADNPDNYYQSAPINGKYDYRLTGKRGTVHYLGFGTQEGNYGSTGSLATTGYLDASELAIRPDGSFEIAISSEKRPSNWLPMTAKSRTLVVRQTFLDRTNEKPADLKVERIGGQHVPRPLTPLVIDRGMMASAKFVEGCARLFNQWAHGFKSQLNELPLFDASAATAAGGVPHIAYYHGYWKLSPGEALVIEVKPPPCDYWNFQLNNHWMESLDYRYFQISLNRHSAKSRADGSVQLVVAHRDPGVGNWIDTAGHEFGTMCWRWVRATEHPRPQTRVVRLEDL